MASTLRQQVDERVTTVRTTQKRLADEMGGRIFGGKAQAAAIRGLTSRIEEWAARGIAAASSDKAPEGKGWPGWIAAGDIFLTQMNEIAKTGRRETLQNIAETSRVAAATTASAAAAVARGANKLVKTTVIEAAKTVAEAEKHILSPLMPVLVVGGLIAVAVLVWKLKRTAT